MSEVIGIYVQREWKSIPDKLRSKGWVSDYARRVLGIIIESVLHEDGRTIVLTDHGRNEATGALKKNA